MQCSKLFHIAAALAAAVTVAGCAVEPAASAASAVPPSGKAIVAADGPGMRCIDEPPTGTRLPQRTCRTLEEWKQIEKASRDYGRAIQGPLTKTPGD
jgi:hypothetical protein